MATATTPDSPGCRSPGPAEADMNFRATAIESNTKFEITGIRYCIELTIKQMTAILMAENWTGPVKTTLRQKLLKIDGVSEVEYAGIGGANVFLTLDKALDIPATRERVEGAILEHISICEKAVDHSNSDFA
jgi:hypothetical protein